MSFLYALESIRFPLLDTVMSYITKLGEETIFLIMAIVLFWCVNKRLGYYMMTVGFVGIIANQFLKLAFRIPRPWVKDPNFSIVESARAEATGYSFPSGHTQNIVTICGPAARWFKSKALRWAAVVVVVLVSFSRMYLGVHTPLDVGVSLILGVVLTFVFYPFFREQKDGSNKMLVLIIVMVIASVGYVLFTELFPFPSDIDAENLASGVENAYKLMGAAAGLLVAHILDEKYVKFDTQGTIWIQIVKCVFGLMIIIIIKECLKQPLNTSLPEYVSGSVRYFVIVIFAGAVWPLTFKPLAALAKKSK